MNNDLVSIIVPVYNAEKYLEDTIKSVLCQTYTNFELILVNDCSTDTSLEIIKKYIVLDKRIKLINLASNGGPALARNNGIKKCNGRYVCFIDSDDLWVKDKLEKQIKFINDYKCAFSYTGYEFTNSNGIPNGKKVFVPKKINYKQALKNTTIFTSTVMIDLTLLKKEDIYMPNVKSEDTACWWKILKKVTYAYGLNEILSYYRRDRKTLSSNKLEAIKRIWHLYREQEKLDIFLSVYCFLGYAFNAVKRRV